MRNPHQKKCPEFASQSHQPAVAEVRAVVVLDDGFSIVRCDGALEPVLAGGHPRPGLAHSTAGRRS